MEKKYSHTNKTINITEVEANIPALTLQEAEANSRRRVNEISEEFKKGFSFIMHHPKSVTIFGSARFKEDSMYYQKARRVAKRISKEGFAVVIGGGPGIMEAANRGAVEGDSHEKSIGICIRLPNEQITNPYVTDGIELKYFFSRKVMLTFSAEAFIYFPGGFGTLDEFFEIITLVQTGKIERVPIILVGTDFWHPFDSFIKKTLIEKFKTIREDDVDLYTITDNEDLILDIVKKAPLRRE